MIRFFRLSTNRRLFSTSSILSDQNSSNNNNNNNKNLESRKERRRREALEASRKTHGGSLRRDGDLFIGRTGLWQVIIGIEVHAQINSNHKLFSG